MNDKYGEIMKPLFKYALATLLVFSLNCGGSSTSSNTGSDSDNNGDNQRSPSSTNAVVVATVNSGNAGSNLIRGLTNDQINNLKIFAFDADGNKVEGTITNGAISIVLNANTQYKINFSANGRFVAEYVYTNAAGRNSNRFMFTSNGEKNLGSMSFNGFKAFSSRNPLSIDVNEDGVSNFADASFNQSFFNDDFDGYVDVNIECASDQANPFISESSGDPAGPLNDDRSGSGSNGDNAGGEFPDINDPVEGPVAADGGEAFLECFDLDQEEFCVDENNVFFDEDGNEVDEDEIFGQGLVFNQALSATSASPDSDPFNSFEIQPTFNVEECFYVEVERGAVSEDGGFSPAPEYGNYGFEEEFEDRVFGGIQVRPDDNLDGLDGEVDGIIDLSGIDENNPDFDEAEESALSIQQSLDFCFDENGDFIYGCEEFIIDCSNQCNVNICDNPQTIEDENGEKVRVVSLECIEDILDCFDECLEI